MFSLNISRNSTVFTGIGLALGLLASGSLAIAQQVSDSSTPQVASPSQSFIASTVSPATKLSVVPAKGKKDKNAYTGPTTIAILPAMPMLDGEGKQRVDPDGNLMFNPPVQQIRDKKGHPVFDVTGKPVFQTATNLGCDEKGKKISSKKVKPPKMTPLSISAGTLTVDGWTGKARLNYDIADLKFLYIYAPGIGITIISQNAFPGATAQPGAFGDKSLRITVDKHTIEIASEKRMLGKKPQPAWVAVDRGFLLPAKFPEFGYGATIKAPYAWPGSKQNSETSGVAKAPELPPDVRPTLLLAPCPAGKMRAATSTVLPGQKTTQQPCLAIASQTPSTASVSMSTSNRVQ